MFEYLNSIDTQLFLFFNVALANPVFDVFMPIITNKYVWIPIWLIIITGLIWKGGKKGRWAVLIAIVAVSSADLFAS